MSRLAFLVEIHKSRQFNDAPIPAVKAAVSLSRVAAPRALEKPQPKVHNALRRDCAIFIDEIFVDQFSFAANLSGLDELPAEFGRSFRALANGIAAPIRPVTYRFCSRT